LNETGWREEICRVGKSLFDRGYVHATAGNISVRLDDGYLITPTDACLGNLDPARLARLDAEGLQQSGDKASKTIALHKQIYRATDAYKADARCVIHTHSTHCVSLTLSLPYQRVLPRTALGPELLRAVTPYFVMKVGHVPLIPYYRPGAAQAADAVADAIHRYGQAGIRIRSAMLSRLGPNVWHSTPAAAMATLEELEETAKLVCLNASMVDVLTELQINELRQTFGAEW
jgi:ribulose-5-phosphate 4-epimerase/fuculose-1-phosphate aldolase